MAILKIARMGHPVLLARARPVDDPTAPEIRRLATDMAETLADAGGVGLAAPQVHESLRLILVSAPPERDEDGAAGVPVTVLVNPVLEPLGAEMVTGWEGCLSIPGLRGAVPRHRRVRFSGLDLDGAPIAGEAEGFHARVLQHEVDHLDGILYPMRMSDLGLLGFEEELMRRLRAGREGDER